MSEAVILYSFFNSTLSKVVSYAASLWQLAQRFYSVFAPSMQLYICWMIIYIFKLGGEVDEPPCIFVIKLSLLLLSFSLLFLLSCLLSSPPLVSFFIVLLLFFFAFFVYPGVGNGKLLTCSLHFLFHLFICCLFLFSVFWFYINCFG